MGATLAWSASDRLIPIDDSGLIQTEHWRGSPSVDILPDRVQSVVASGLILQVVRSGGQAVVGLPFDVRAGQSSARRVTDDFGKIAWDCRYGEPVHVELQLDSEYFSVSNGRKLYQLKMDAFCGNSIRLEFDSHSVGGQVFGIWQVAGRAVNKLRSAVGLSFWRKKVKFIWPSQGDYYEDSEVYLTRGDAWDVVGHELGHAVSAMGGIVQPAGGSHRVNECVSEELALSEGWASFFSGWLSLDLGAEDPRFEFLAPGYSPLSIENVPSSFCMGTSNEWRVATFLWDLVDRHNDGEKYELPFGKLWKDILGQHLETIDDFRNALYRNGESAQDISLIWYNNFIKR